VTDAQDGAVGPEPGRPSGAPEGGATPPPGGETPSPGPGRRQAFLDAVAPVVDRLRPALSRPGVRRIVAGAAALALILSGMVLQRQLSSPDSAALTTASVVGPPSAGSLGDPSGPVTDGPSTGAAASTLPGTDQVVAGTAADGPPLAETDDKAPAATAVHIPKLGINQPLVGLHIQGDQSLSVPTQFSDIGWWDAGPRPGAAGAVVVAGHVTSRAGPAIFARLKDLSTGDQVMVDRADKTTAVFQVVDKRAYSRASFPDDVVYRTAGKASLHLVTCDGAFDAAVGQYPDNLVVFADLVSTRPTS
jgi:LPXTG-site transpeptidase (sortase) family protein